MNYEIASYDMKIKNNCNLIQYTQINNINHAKMHRNIKLFSICFKIVYLDTLTYFLLYFLFLLTFFQT